MPDEAAAALAMWAALCQQAALLNLGPLELAKLPGGNLQGCRHHVLQKLSGVLCVNAADLLHRVFCPESWYCCAFVLPLAACLAWHKGAQAVLTFCLGTLDVMHLWCAAFHVVELFMQCKMRSLHCK